MDVKELVFSLCTVPGMAGSEGKAAEYAAGLLRRYTENVAVDHMGNVTATLGKGNGGILLDAHLDQIGLIVTYLDERGFVRFQKCGGTDRRVLIGKPVIIYGKEPVRGIISSVPPHLAGADDAKLPDFADMMIDTGLPEEQMREKVAPGAPVLIDIAPRSLLGSRITAPALDNRSSVAALIYCLELLRGKALPCALTVQLTVQEETNAAGAHTGTFGANVREAIAVDVSFAQAPGVPPEQDAHLGKGPMIGVAPSLSSGVSRRLEALAKEYGLPHQMEVMGGSTGTNADAISVSRTGIPCGLVSIPQRNMHTAVEIVDVNDVKNTARLLAAYVEKGGVYGG